MESLLISTSSDNTGNTVTINPTRVLQNVLVTSSAEVTDTGQSVSEIETLSTSSLFTTILDPLTNTMGLFSEMAGNTPVSLSSSLPELQVVTTSSVNSASHYPVNLSTSIIPTSTIQIHSQQSIYMDGLLPTWFPEEIIPSSNIDTVTPSLSTLSSVDTTPETSSILPFLPNIIVPSSSTLPPDIMVTPSSPSFETSSRNISDYGPASAPEAQLPLGLIIALPVCIAISALICVLALLFVVQKRRRLKGHPKSKRTGSDKELWMNTPLELPPLPPSPASIENGHIIPLSEALPEKDDTELYEVTQDFEARLETQLSLNMGQSISVLEKADNGWWRGNHGDKIGWFPGDFVKKANEKNKLDIPKAPVEIDETTVDSNRQLKPAVSSFLIRKKGQEDKTPAQILKESKGQGTAIDQNANGVIPNGNVIKGDQESLNKDKDLTSLNESGSNSSLPLTGSTLNKGLTCFSGRYRVIYPYIATREGEITIVENDVIEFLEEGTIGWVRGRREATDEEGWVPASYLQRLNEDTMNGSSSFEHLKQQLISNRQLSKAQEHFVGIEHQAIYGYVAQHAEDLSFEAGDSIIVLDALETGWWHGLKGETTGWFPGSYVEIRGSSDSSPSGGIYDKGGKLLSDSDQVSSISGSLTPSQDSYQGDLIKNLGEALAKRQEISDTLSIGSASTTGSNESRPKPVRKAPPPPTGRTVKKKVLRRPSRPAPPPPAPPPAPPAEKTKGDNLDTEPGSMGNTAVVSLDAAAPAATKPPPPKRTVTATKTVKVPKTQLKLENSNMLPSPPDRPVPPKPPAKGKFSIRNLKKRSKKSKSFDSKNRGSLSRLTKADISGPVTLEDLYVKPKDKVVTESLSIEKTDPLPKNGLSEDVSFSNHKDMDNNIEDTNNSEVKGDSPRVVLRNKLLNEVSSSTKPKLEKSQSHNPPPVAPKPKHISLSRLSQKSPQPKDSEEKAGVVSPENTINKSSPPPQVTETSKESEEEYKKKAHKKSLKKAIRTHVKQDESELSFEQGSFIKQLENETSRPGWNMGMLADGTVGWYPSDYVEDTTLRKNSST